MNDSARKQKDKKKEKDGQFDTPLSSESTKSFLRKFRKKKEIELSFEGQTKFF
jgi:hypothetical protein